MDDGWDRSTVDLPGGVSLPAERKPAPARLGRYEITEPIAGGGMGFVYAAYDPELDRKVALKVVHPRRSHNPGSHSRLIKEARALARLDHPNVVKVHDVFSHEEQIVVVMELVAGETLSDWEAAKPRTWREIVEVYVQAGDGLAAAHALDIVHRDFKPHNAIIGTDGRVRVLDFGLARMTADDVADSDDPAASGAITQTVPGAVMGTPAYAAPEQLEGGACTPASDQFSFCVALHRALEGKPPFSGESINALVRAIRNEVPAKSDRALPAWLRALVARGLEPNPQLRHPSMDALLVGLKKVRGWKRWRWPAAVTALVATAGVTSFSLRGDASSVVPCDGGEIATVWNLSSRMAVGVAIEKIGTPYAHEVADKVLGGMDSHARAWSEAHRGACMAHRGGASSDLMFDRQTSCLAQKLGEIKSAVSVLQQISEEELSGAADVTAGVHQAQACMDVSRLLDDSVPPPELRIRVVRIREHISQAAALRQAGRIEASERTIAAAIADAKATGYQPAIAESELELGRLLIVSSALERAVPVLREAMQTALASNLPALAVEATARRIYVESSLTLNLGRALRDFEFAEAMSRSIVGNHFARALLLNNMGTAFFNAQRPDDGLAYYLQARAAIKGEAFVDIELSCIDYNIGQVSPDAAVRVRTLDQVAERRAAALGAHHPLTLEARYAAADLGDELDVALGRLKPICDDYSRYSTLSANPFLVCKHNVALLEEVSGNLDEAERALAIVASTSDPSSSRIRTLAKGELALFHGDIVVATTLLQSIVASTTDANEVAYKWEAQLYLARIAARAHRDKEAEQDARSALAGFESIRKTNYAIEYRLRTVQTMAILRH